MTQHVGANIRCAERANSRQSCGQNAARERISLLKTNFIPFPFAVDGREITFSAQAFINPATGEQVLALVRPPNDATVGEAPLVRIHSGCVTGDIFRSRRCDCHDQLQIALNSIVASALGAVIYAPAHEGRGIGLYNKLSAYALQDRGLDTVDANVALGLPVDARDFSMAANVLIELGMTAVKLLTNNPDKAAALETFGIAVLEQIPLRVRSNQHNDRYLKTKRDRLLHTI